MAFALPPCPDTPNCVSTLAPRESRAFMPALVFTVSEEDARRAVVEVLRSMREAEVVSEEPTHLRAEFTSRIFRYVDDVDIVINPHLGRIDFRSASRVGHWDLGANRRRMRVFSRRLTGREGFSIAP